MYNYNLAKLFYSIVTTYSDKTALYYSQDSQVSFEKLNSLSNQIANYLIEFKVEKYDVIGIFNTKKTESYALMLACLKIGAIYVNLDITNPVERLRKIIDRCLPKYLFFDDESSTEKISCFKIKTLNINSRSTLEVMNRMNTDNLNISSSICANNPAYIMFTSGSTGFPKGAVMTHQNLLNFINWAQDEYNIVPTDIFTNVNPMYFDNSVFDFYSSLFNGATLVPFEAEAVQNPKKTVDRVDEAEATIWFSVPSLLVFLLTTKSISEKSFQNIRLITFGGEGFPKTKLKELYRLFKDRIRFVNVYGPTECTCICSAYDISENDFYDLKNLAPLGRISPNFDYIILNKENKTKIGELALAGPQVGLGYYKDPERTANSFVRDPRYPFIKQIIYKTGDLVQEDNNGLLHFQGRVDNQIKYMGYRIELEEIESGFNSLSYVNETGVYYQSFENGLGQIVAFISLSKNIETTKIFEDIRRILPSYMVPKQIHILSRLPKNQNGKIDRVALKNLN